MIEALHRANLGDFSPEVLEQFALAGARLASAPTDPMRTPDLAALLRLTTDHRRRQARQHLHQAALLMAESGMTNWQTAAALRDELEAFEARIAPLVRRNPHHTLTPLQRHISAALNCRVSLPRAHEAIYRTLF